MTQTSALFWSEVESAGSTIYIHKIRKILTPILELSPSESENSSEEKPQELRDLRPSILESIDESWKMPAHPAILDKLESMMISEEASAQDVAEVISLDPGLAASVVRLANSASFALSRTIESIQQAVVYVGIKRIRTIAYSASVFNVFAQPAKQMHDPNMFWKHSIGVATGCQLIANNLLERDRLEINPDEFFLIGLMHDIGKILVAQNSPKKYSEILELLARSLELRIAEERLLGVQHGEVSAKLMEDWGMSKAARLAVLHHHEPNGFGSGPAIVHLADFLTHCLGYGFEKGRVPYFYSSVLGTLEISNDVLKSISAKMVEQMENAESLFE